ncbi:MAG: hypothetical protein ACKOEM_17950 [Planctomycetia bacterium]
MNAFSTAWPFFAGPLLAVALASGCGKLSGPKTVEVTGRVTLDGKPLAGVILQFEPDESGVAPGKKALPTAFGTTDADGRYRAFRTGNKAYGAVVGLSNVRITVPEGSTAKVHPRYLADGTFWHEIGPGPTVVDLELVADPTAVRRQASEPASE